MNIELPVFAGIISSTIFASSMLPMLMKVNKTRNVESFSLSHLLLSNVGNIIHSVYVFSLPPGPIWLLHTFYLVTMGLMLLWYVMWVHKPHRDATA